jgi:hypothetical protein
MTAFGPDLPRFAELAPGIRRLLAPNPSMMTGPGTIPTCSAPPKSP